MRKKRDNDTCRPLRVAEIAQLQLQGCSAENWMKILVDEAFTPDYLSQVRFYGNIRLGTFGGDVLTPGGVKRPSGIRDAELRNVSVGDNCLIEHIGSYIANYEIGAGSYLSQVGLLETTGTTAFGNGTEIYVLRETGGEPNMVLHKDLTAQMAYLMLSHSEELCMRLIHMIRCEVYPTTTGHIGSHSCIVRTSELRNVWVGDGAWIENAALLTDSYLNSYLDAPVRIGTGVILRSSIVCPAAEVVDYAKVIQCFVGEATHIGLGFSASSSLFFANCHMDNGEASSVVAGPFTVSHHKSTLLIGCMLSFANLGSGTNMSNHRYKLGPIHSGVLERGCKTASGAHLVWPSNIGAYTMVMGKVDDTLDTTYFPFSYIISEGGFIHLKPGAAAMKLGSFRDSCKWPLREKRPVTRRADIISSYSLFSPDMAANMSKGIEKLKKVPYGRKLNNYDCYSCQGWQVSGYSLKRGLAVYRQMLSLLWGECYLDYVAHCEANGLEPLLNGDGERDLLADDSTWRDLFGLLVPVEHLEHLIADFEQEPQAYNLSRLRARFEQWNSSYQEYLSKWVVRHLIGNSVEKSLELYVENLRSYSETLKADLEKEIDLCNVPKEMLDELQLQLGASLLPRMDKAKAILSIIKKQSGK